MLGVGSLADLIGAFLGEAHAEQAQQVTVRGLHVHMGLNHRLRKNQLEIISLFVDFMSSVHSRGADAPTLTNLPLLDHGAHLVAGQIHAMKVGQAVLALDVLGDELELAEGHLVVLQVSEAHLKHAAL